jgi:hypothetical protein
MEKFLFKSCRIPCSNPECKLLIATTIDELRKNERLVCQNCSAVTAVDVEQVIERHRHLMERLRLLMPED